MKQGMPTAVGCFLVPYNTDRGMDSSSAYHPPKPINRDGIHAENIVSLFLIGTSCALTSTLAKMG